MVHQTLTVRAAVASTAVVGIVKLPCRYEQAQVLHSPNDKRHFTRDDSDVVLFPSSSSMDILVHRLVVCYAANARLTTLCPVWLCRLSTDR